MERITVSTIIRTPIHVFTPAAGFLLDQLSITAEGAWSFRKLRDAYAGSAARIRESGGNTEADIGFDANGDFDTAAAATHIGANNGFIVKMYDQSGNGNDLAQSTAGLQPPYSATGLNSLPTMDFIRATGHYIEIANLTPTSTTELSVYEVADVDLGNNFDRLASFTANGETSDTNNTKSVVIAYCQSNTSLRGHLNGSDKSAGTYSTGTPFSFGSVWDGTDHTMYINNSGGTPTSYTFGLDTAGTFTIAKQAVADADKFDGQISEIILFFDTPTSGDRTLIDTSHSDYWGV